MTSPREVTAEVCGAEGCDRGTVCGDGKLRCYRCRRERSAAPREVTTETAGSWTDAQVRDFAKRFTFANKACWPAYVDDVREALIDSYVLLIVLGQDRHGVTIDEIRSLRSRIGARLASRHSMANPIAKQVATINAAKAGS